MSSIPDCIKDGDCCYCPHTGDKIIDANLGCRNCCQCITPLVTVSVAVDSASGVCPSCNARIKQTICGGPDPPRVWTRDSGECYYTGQVSLEDLNMRRKAEILKYNRKFNRPTKKQWYAQLARGNIRTKQSYATQSTTYTNFNTGGCAGPTPPCRQQTGRFGPGTPDGTIIECEDPLIMCASTTASDVPGPPQVLCYNRNVPLTNFIKRYKYSGNDNKFPQRCWEPGMNGFPRGKAGRKRLSHHKGLFLS